MSFLGRFCCQFLLPSLFQALLLKCEDLEHRLAVAQAAVEEDGDITSKLRQADDEIARLLSLLSRRNAEHEADLDKWMKQARQEELMKQDAEKGKAKAVMEVAQAEALVAEATAKVTKAVSEAKTEENLKIEALNKLNTAIQEREVLQVKNQGLARQIAGLERDILVFEATLEELSRHGEEEKSIDLTRLNEEKEVLNHLALALV